MDVDNIKFIGTILLWVCMVFFGLLPLKVRHFKTNKALLSLSNCFSGGLFIAIGLIHVLPEAHENLEGKKQKQLHGEEYVFPLSYAICLATFSFILLIDKVIFSNESIAHRDLDKPVDLQHSVFLNKFESAHDAEENFKELVSSHYKVALGLSHIKSGYHDFEENVHNHFDVGKEITHDIENHDRIPGRQSQQFMPNMLHPNYLPEEKNEQLLSHNSHNDHGHHGHTHRMVTAKDTGVTAYILLLAMGIHGFFAGIAFGVARTKGEAINMFIAMIAHKWSEALTVGVSFISAGVETKKSTYMIVFLACITPVGVFIGYLISEMSDFVVGIALAISAGTFIYISCAEIIIEEFSISKHKFPKFISYVIGIVFIGFVGTLEG